MCELILSEHHEPLIVANEEVQIQLSVMVQDEIKKIDSLVHEDVYVNQWTKSNPHIKKDLLLHGI
jgi:hypothetical protein